MILLRFLESKKGVEFNMIFVLVAGVIILLFFVGFAYRHINVSKTFTDKQVLFRIESDLESYGKAFESDKPLNIPSDLSLDFKCGVINVNQEVKNTNLIIFSPDTLLSKGFVWTKSWDYPFKITNLFYVAGSDTIFFVVDNQDVYRNLPVRFKKFYLNKENTDLISDKLQNPNSVFVVNGDINLPANYKAKVVQIYPNNELKINGRSTIYYGDEMLYGAVFSRNLEDFECLQRKSLEHLKRISDIYRGKADLLKNRRDCGSIYTGISTILGGITNDPISANENLKLQNRNLEKNWCVPIF